MWARVGKLLRLVLILVLLLIAAVLLIIRFAPGFAVNVPVSAYVGNALTDTSQNNLAHTIARLTVPAGFTLSLYADHLPGARVVLPTGNGDLLVSQPREKRITLLHADHNGDGKPDSAEMLLGNLNYPHGLALLDGWLYVAENDAVGRVRYAAQLGKISGEYTRIVTGLPVGGNHISRTIAAGPDGKLYLTAGSSCNVCIEQDPQRAAMMRFDPDGSNLEIIASGLRNSVGFDWSPTDGELYATDNGRDLLGDDFPPCELNRIEPGKFYGWPYRNGNNIVDPDFGTQMPENVIATPPVHSFRAHNAPLGLHFLRHQNSGYQHSALVALHGSWNRSVKDGYQVTSLHWQNGNIYECPFVSGFLAHDDVIGRPAGVAEDDNGAIYIADDFNGAIYRVVQTAKVEMVDPAVCEGGARLTTKF